MPNLYKQLIKDHINLSHVLTLLDQEVEQCDHEAWNNPNLPLILDALEYVQAYPERFHHPVEEAVFRYMVNNQLGDRQIITTVQAQHDNLEKETVWLQEQFSELANYGDRASPRLRKRFKDYLDFQREHIAAENKHIFPILEAFDENIWWDIASQLVLLKDPVFDSPARREFGELLRQIDNDSVSFVDQPEIEVFDEIPSNITRSKI